MLVLKFPAYGIVSFMMWCIILIYSLFSPTASSFLDGNTIIYIVVLCALVLSLYWWSLYHAACVYQGEGEKIRMIVFVAYYVVCYKQWFYLYAGKFDFLTSDVKQWFAGKLNFLMSDVKTKMWVTHLLNCVAYTNWVYFICHRVHHHDWSSSPSPTSKSIKDQNIWNKNL